MAELDFERTLVDLFAEPPAVLGAEDFVRGVEARLERGWTMRRWLIGGLPLVILFFTAGVIFAYLLLLPNAMSFLLGFGSQDIINNILLSKYISFVTTFLLMVGLVFELPPVMFMLAKLGVVSAKRMAGFRRYAIVLIVIIAAIITPTPDPFNQMAVAIPMYILYELGILFARFA